MKEETQVVLSFTINKEVLIKEDIYYAIRWTREGITKLIENPDEFVFKSNKYTLREAWGKVKLISELNPGLINKIKIISK
jgi:hypothetical protein